MAKAAAQKAADENKLRALALLADGVARSSEQIARELKIEYEQAKRIMSSLRGLRKVVTDEIRPGTGHQKLHTLPQFADKLPTQEQFDDMAIKPKPAIVRPQEIAYAASVFSWGTQFRPETEDDRRRDTLAEVLKILREKGRHYQQHSKKAEAGLVFALVKIINDKLGDHARR